MSYLVLSWRNNCKLDTSLLTETVLLRMKISFTCTDCCFLVPKMSSTLFLCTPSNGLSFCHWNSNDNHAAEELVFSTNWTEATKFWLCTYKSLLLSTCSLRYWAPLQTCLSEWVGFHLEFFLFIPNVLTHVYSLNSSQHKGKQWVSRTLRSEVQRVWHRFDSTSYVQGKPGLFRQVMSRRRLCKQLGLFRWCPQEMGWTI